LEVGWEKGEGAVKIVDGFEVKVAFVACRKGMMATDDSLGFIVYLQRKSKERIHHGGPPVVLLDFETRITRKLLPNLIAGRKP